MGKSIQSTMGYLNVGLVPITIYHDKAPFCIKFTNIIGAIMSENVPLTCVPCEDSDQSAHSD